MTTVTVRTTVVTMTLENNEETRADGRALDQLRSVRMTRGWSGTGEAPY